MFFYFYFFYLLNCLFNGFKINISVSLSHVGNIGSVLYTLFTCLSSPFTTARLFHLLGWWLRMWIYLMQCYIFINSSSYTPINWSIYWFLLFILPHSTRPYIGGRVLPFLTPIHRGVFNQSSNILGYKVSSLVIKLQVRDATDCLGLLSETLHGQFVLKCNRVGLYEKAFCKI